MRYIVALALLGIGITALGQDGTTYGVFPTIDHSGDLSDRWSYNVYLFDAIKLGDDGGTSATIRNGSFYAYVEGGLSFKPVKPLALTMAYVHERQFPFQEGERIEHRIFQQLTYKLRAERCEAKFRARFDERWIHYAEGGSTTFSHRLRLLAGLKYPTDTRTYLTGYFEGFLTSSNNFSYDEMWSNVQVGFKLGECNAVEIGPLFIDWRMPDGWLGQRYLQFTWVSHVDWRKARQPQP